jgi:hypothetical protein
VDVVARGVQDSKPKKIFLLDSCEVSVRDPAAYAFDVRTRAGRTMQLFAPDEEQMHAVCAAGGLILMWRWFLW